MLFPGQTTTNHTQANASGQFNAHSYSHAVEQQSVSQGLYQKPRDPYLS